jgi:hypothetical protein
MNDLSIVMPMDRRRQHADLKVRLELLATLSDFDGVAAVTSGASNVDSERSTKPLQIMFATDHRASPPTSVLTTLSASLGRSWSCPTMASSSQVCQYHFKRYCCSDGLRHKLPSLHFATCVGQACRKLRIREAYYRDQLREHML